MTFVLTEDQDMLRDTAMTFVREELPVKHLRDLRDAGKNGVDPEGRAKLAELGFFGVLIPEEHGGVEMGMVALGQIMEAQGRTLAATPMLQTACIGASTLLLGGTEAQKAEWLPKIAAGEITTALALDEGTHHNPTGVATEAERNGQGYTLNGAKKFVQDGHFAELLIVIARTFGEPGQTHGLTIFLVPSDAAGVTITPLKTVDSHGAAHITFDDVHVADSHVIGAADKGWEVLEPVLDRGCIALASEALGSSIAAFEMTLDYLQTRKQFGQLIGSFQGLQHRAARMFTDIELTRSCVSAALTAVDEQRNDIGELASLAKARASETVHLLSNETVQMHGGIGMTDAHESGFYMKRARVQEAMLGSASYHRDRYARLNNF